MDLQLNWFSLSMFVRRHAAHSVMTAADTFAVTDSARWPLFLQDVTAREMNMLLGALSCICLRRVHLPAAVRARASHLALCEPNLDLTYYRKAMGGRLKLVEDHIKSVEAAMASSLPPLVLPDNVFDEDADVEIDLVAEEGDAAAAAEELADDDDDDDEDAADE